jgi:hypothetical protein
VRYITAITDSTTFTLDDLTYSTVLACGALTPKTTPSGNYANQIKDDVDDSVVSSRIGTYGLKSRFYTAMPACNTGVFVPGFVVIGHQNQFLWNNIDIFQQYIIGNCHPAYQAQQINGEVTAMAVNQNYVSIFTNNNTYSVQTNLNTSYTDQNNGNVIYTLPNPVLTDMYIGVRSDTHIYPYERDLVVAVNQDNGVRTWNGTQWSENLIFKKIQNKVRLLTSFIVTYDVKYGVIVIGTDAVNYNRFYTIGIRNDKYLGCSEFNLLPYPDVDVQPLNVNTRMIYFPLGVTTGRWADGQAVTWLENSTIDVPNSTVPGTGYPIAWSFTTGDDKGSDQANTLRHLESYLFVSGRGTNEAVPSAVAINCTIYNDIGTQVTINRFLPAMPYYTGSIQFDKRSDGHRIRYKFDFDSAVLVINGMMTYYAGYDKSPSIILRQTQEDTWQTQILSPVAWVSRTTPLLNLASGQVLETHGTVSRATGPDGRTSAICT